MLPFNNEIVVATRNSFPHNASSGDSATIIDGEVLIVVDVIDRDHGKYKWVMLGSSGLYHWYGTIQIFNRNFKIGK